MVSGGGSPRRGRGSETGKAVSSILIAVARKTSAGKPASRGISGNAGDEEVACVRHCAWQASGAGPCDSFPPASWQGTCAMAAAGCTALPALACASAVLWHSSTTTAVMPARVRLAAFESVMGRDTSRGAGIAQIPCFDRLR